MIINIRGTNGSGKTTLARAFQTPLAQTVNLVEYASPTKRNPDRKKWVTGELSEFADLGKVICVGSYSQVQGGLDTVGSFEAQQAAVQAAAYMKGVDHVICEGILASTVAGSWLTFFKEMNGRWKGLSEGQCRVGVVYLQTPVETCLERITQRQERAGKVRPIKVDQVKDKVRAIQATRIKFQSAGVQTYSLDVGEEVHQLTEIMTREAS